MSVVFPDHPLQVRLATANDVPVILDLIRELATYEKEPHAVRATATDLHRDGFGPVPRFHVFLADWLGASVGFALYCYNYFTWEGHHGITLKIFLSALSSGAGALVVLWSARSLPWRWWKAAHAWNGGFWTGISRPSTFTTSSAHRSHPTGGSCV